MFARHFLVSVMVAAAWPVASLVIPQYANAAPPMCDMVDCSGGCYDAMWPAGWVTGTAGCEGEYVSPGMLKFTLMSYQAPSPAFVNCEGTGAGFLCTAYPTGDGFLYYWGSTGDAYLPFPSALDSNTAMFSCLGMGQMSDISVTVVSPYNVTASATMRVGRCNP